MRLAVLGSGSGGNSLIIESGGRRLLVDAGFSCRQIERRLASLGEELAGVDALLLTHDLTVYAVEPNEKARLCADLATVPDRLSVETFEGAVRRAGFAVQAIDRIGSEWLEALLEGEDGEKRLLRAARMQRAKDDMVAAVGVVPFRVMQANNLWTIYRMIGKLEERVYTLTLDGA